MNNKKMKYVKLIRMLIANDKKLLLISVLAVIIGFGFLLTITSLSETIIKTKQDQTVKTYGKFLMVIPEITEESADNIKQECSQFKFERFGVLGNVEHENKKITMGTMKEYMGENLGFQVIKGKWPQTSNQIVIEEYLTHLFGIENEELPVCVSLQKDRTSVKYEITGIISNYSYLLSTSYGEYTENKAYPSIICDGENNQDAKQSLVIMQKELNFKSAEKDIDFLFSKIYADIMCVNEKLYDYGYQSNEDMMHMRVVYIVLLDLLLLLAQIVVIRAFILRNKKTFLIFEALGMSSKEKNKVIFYLMQGLVLLGLIIGYLLAVLIGLTYMNSAFGVYNKYYVNSLHYMLLVEIIIVCVLSAGGYYFGYINRKDVVINEIIPNTSERQKKYRFKKLDFNVVIIQTVCIFFTIASFYFVNMFSDVYNDIEFNLYSKRDAACYPIKEYLIALYGNDYFTFDSFDVFNEYKDYINVYAEAETKQSTILLDKDNVDSYFRQYCDEYHESINPKDELLWKQVSAKAEQYTLISTNELEIIVLSQNDFQEFLSTNGINSTVLEQNSERACVLRLPNYDQIPYNPSIKEKGMIQLGRIQGDRNNAEFFTESFKVESLLTYNDEEYGNIQVIMSEEVAKKSNAVVGYDVIRVKMKKDTPVSIQKGVEQKVSFLMASIQGGLFDSSLLRSEEDSLMRNYTSIMSNIMMIFCIVVICIYIILTTYIDWEKYSHEYGVLRSFGMSYSRLQSKLFLKYINSIIVACIINMFIGKYAFSDVLLTNHDILISIVITFVVTYICRIYVFYKQKRQSISSMLNKG